MIIMGDSIWDIVVNNERKLALENFETRNNKTLLIVGSQGVGKSTLLHGFVDRKDIPKPTLALDYSFCRKISQNMSKDVCHIWELGGGSVHDNLLESLFLNGTSSKLSHLKIILMVDLSEPTKLLFTTQKLLYKLKYLLKKDSNEKMKAPEDLKDPEDWKKLVPFSVPLTIIGGKFDEFQMFEPEKKKIICRILRFMAHHHGASLQFYSSKEPVLLKRGFDLLGHLAFDTPHWNGFCQDYNKPLYVPFGSDSFNSIGGNSSGTDDAFKGSHSPDVWKQQYTTYFPQIESEISELPPDHSHDPNFSEFSIDSLLKEKEEALERKSRTTNDIWKSIYVE